MPTISADYLEIIEEVRIEDIKSLGFGPRRLPRHFHPSVPFLTHCTNRAVFGSGRGWLRPSLFWGVWSSPPSHASTPQNKTHDLMQLWPRNIPPFRFYSNHAFIKRSSADGLQWPQRVLLFWETNQHQGGGIKRKICANPSVRKTLTVT